MKNREAARRVRERRASQINQYKLQVSVVVGVPGCSRASGMTEQQ